MSATRTDDDEWGIFPRMDIQYPMIKMTRRPEPKPDLNIPMPREIVARENMVGGSLAFRLRRK